MRDRKKWTIVLTSRQNCLTALSIAVLATVLSEGQAYGQAAVYIVRHAEKESGSGDVSLSIQGQQRAAALGTLLKQANVTAIYASDAVRTQQTAKPLADLRHITPKIIPTGNPKTTFDDIHANHKKDIVLIVGHSDMIGPLIVKWDPQANITIADDEFDAIFVVTPSQSGVGWTRFKYANATH